MKDFELTGQGYHYRATFDSDFLAAALCEDVINTFGNRSHPNFIDPVQYGDDTGHFHTAEKSFHYLPQYANWADHGYLNAVMAKVHYLHNLTKLMAKTGYQTTTFKEELLVRALETFQRWKTAMIAQERSTRGDHWGSALLFYNLDFAEYCPAIMGTGPIPIEVIAITPDSNSCHPLHIRPTMEDIEQFLGGSLGSKAVSFLGHNAFYCLNREEERWFNVDGKMYFSGRTLVVGIERDGGNQIGAWTDTDLDYADLEQKIKWQPDPEADNE